MWVAASVHKPKPSNSDFTAVAVRFLGQQFGGGPECQKVIDQEMISAAFIPVMEMGTDACLLDDRVAFHNCIVCLFSGLPALLYKDFFPNKVPQR